MLRNENPYGFHLWYLPTLFWFSLTAWLLDKALSPAAARTAKLVLVVALPVCYQLLFTEWFWAVKSYFQQGAFFVLRFDRKARKIALPDSLRLGSDGFKILIRYLTLEIELRLLKAYV